MSKALRIVGTIAGIAAFVTGNPIFAAVAMAANVGADLTQKKPPARGSTSNVLIGANMPMIYSMGRTYVGGNQILDVGYGGEVNDVKNPYRSMVLLWSNGGPADEIEAFQADFTTITFSSGNASGYYHDWLYLDTQLGATPEGSALAGPFGAIPQWGAAYKLSGYAAGLITAKFDKKAKRYASGLPQFGAIGKWVKVYDPRLDSTYPGGSGTHRFDDETTWEWSESPALHGIAYARGRYQNDKKVFGCGFREEGIDLAAWVEFANVCDANEWVLGGTIYEPGSRWDNLKRICAAGAAEPVFVGARLSVKFNAPKLSLDTITAADLADGEISIPAMKTWRTRINGIIPKYRSEEHKWEYVQSDLVSVPDYVTEDGEEKNEERQIDLIQDKDQAAQVCTYELVNGRELGPIVIPCKPRLSAYVPGEALTLDLPDDAGLSNQLCVITGRRVDPATAIVELTLETETTAKHAFALGQTGTAPPAPTLTDGEELDDVVTSGQPSSTPHIVASEAEMNDLVTDGSVIIGDVAIRTDVSSTFIYNGGTTGTATDWTEALSPTGISPSYLDTDVTLAANSDVKIATQKATKTYVDSAVTGLFDFKGSTDCSANPNYPAALKGDAYVVSVAGKIGGASGKSVDIGDVYVASADNAGGTEASVGTSWFVLEHNLAGALLSANNLSDLANVATARTNLGLVIGTNVQAWDADLDAVANSGLAAAWATYTPTISAGSGSFTTVSAAGRYKQVGKLVIFAIDITITTNGTAGTYIDATLPIASANVAATHRAPVQGVEHQVVGFGLAGYVLNNSSTARCRKSDATYPGGDGYVISLSGIYEAA